MNLQGTPAGQVFTTEHAAEGLPRVGVSVEDVHLQVPLLAGADVAAVRAVPASKSLHDDNICKAVLKWV